MSHPLWEGLSSSYSNIATASTTNTLLSKLMAKQVLTCSTFSRDHVQGSAYLPSWWEALNTLKSGEEEQTEDWDLSRRFRLCVLRSQSSVNALWYNGSLEIKHFNGSELPFSFLLVVKCMAERYLWKSNFLPISGDSNSSLHGGLG